MPFNNNKLLLWIGVSLAGLILMMGILVALLPFITRASFEGWAEGQGLSGSIGKVEIFLTDGQLQLSDIKLLDASNKGLQVGKAFVQIHLRDLWHKRITIEDVQIDTLSVDASRNESGELTIVGLKRQAETPAEKAEKHVKPWQITLVPASLKVIRLCMDMAGTDSQPAYTGCANLQGLAWQGELKLRTGTVTAAPVLDIHGDLKLTGLLVEDKQHGKLLARAESLSLEGIALKKLADITLRKIIVKGLMVEHNQFLAQAESLSFDSVALRDLADIGVKQVAVAKLMVEDSQHKRLLARAELLTLDDITLKELADLTVRQGTVTGGSSLQRTADAPDDFLLSWQKLGLSDMTMHGQSIHLALVSLEGLEASLRRDGKGNLELQQYLAAYQPKPTEKQVDKQDAKAVSLIIDKLVLSGDNKLHIVDEAVTPAVKQSIENIVLTLDKIDTDQPGQVSDITLAMQVGQFGQVEARGNVTLLAPRPTVNVTGKVLALNIADMSAYADEFLQHRINSGQLDADLVVKIEQGKLDSEAKLILHKFYLEPLKTGNKDPYKKELGMSLPSALSLLRSKDDSIAITLPVTGDIEKPDFALGDIINNVIVKAIRITVLTYYSPFGLISLAGKIIDLATVLRFEPVIFAPTSVQLDTKGVQQLQTMSKLLNVRPGVHLVVCGHASMADQQALFPSTIVLKPQAEAASEQAAQGKLASASEKLALSTLQQDTLFSLAIRRGETVKRYFVNDLGIGADRLILCNPEYVENDEKPPRVEISI